MRTYTEVMESEWKKFNGVLCDRKMPVELKGKIYTEQ